MKRIIYLAFCSSTKPRRFIQSDTVLRKLTKWYEPQGVIELLKATNDIKDIAGPRRTRLFDWHEGVTAMRVRRSG